MKRTVAYLYMYIIIMVRLVPLLWICFTLLDDFITSNFWKIKLAYNVLVHVMV